MIAPLAGQEHASEIYDNSKLMLTLASLGITQFAADNPQFRPLSKNKNLQAQIKPNLEPKANPDLKLQTENELNSKTLLEPDIQLFERKSSEGDKYINATFASKEKLLSHYDKHAGEFKGLFKSADEYLEGARDVIKNGYKVEYLYKGETRTGFVQFLENSDNGNSKFAFVGTNNDGYITTFSPRSSSNFWIMLNGDKEPVINPK